MFRAVSEALSQALLRGDCALDLSLGKRYDAGQYETGQTFL